MYTLLKFNKKREKMKKILLGMIAVATLSFGSATMIKGSTQTVSFNSSPEGAIVKIDGIATCTTPCSVMVKNSSKNKVVSFTKKGYSTMSIPMNSSFQAGYFLLDILWDLGTTDFITGALYEYEPNNYMIELKKK
jgi:hypothetical protein